MGLMKFLGMEATGEEGAVPETVTIPLLKGEEIRPRRDFVAEAMAEPIRRMAEELDEKILKPPKDSPARTSEKSAPVKIPGNFKPDLVKIVLGGRGKLFKPLNEMFNWGDTPQGQAHWQSLASNYTGRTHCHGNEWKVPEKDREYLQSLLDAYEDTQRFKLTPKPDPVAAADKIVADAEKEKAVSGQDNSVRDEVLTPTKLPESYKPLDVEKLIKNTYIHHEDLWNAFAWAATPQGQTHWQQLYSKASTGNCRLSPNDIVYLQGLQRLHENKLVKVQCRKEMEKLKAEAARLSEEVEAELPKIPAGFDLFETECVLGLTCGLTGCTGPSQAKHLGKAFDWKTTPQDAGIWKKLHWQMMQSDNAIDLKKHRHLIYDYLLGVVAMHGQQQNGKSQKLELKVKITEPKKVTLVEHLAKQNKDYLRLLLVEVNYDYEAAVLKLMGDCLQLDEAETRKSLKGRLLELLETLRDEVASCFNGSGRLLGTGPETVDCFLSCNSQFIWYLSERDSTNGALREQTPIASAFAHHLIQATDMGLTIEQDAKVRCLHNLMLLRW